MILEEAAAEAPEVWDQQRAGNATKWDGGGSQRREKDGSSGEPKAASRGPRVPLCRAAEAEPGAVQSPRRAKVNTSGTSSGVSNSSRRLQKAWKSDWPEIS